jgi:hypothetical protein
MAVILIFASAIAVVTSESNPTLFGIVKRISFAFLAFDIVNSSFPD